MKPTGDRIAAIFLLLFGVFVSVESRGLAYWTANAPGPGFLPFWLGVLLAVVSAAIVVQSVATAQRDAASATVTDGRRVATLLGLAAAAAVLAILIGFVPAIGIFIGITLTYLRPREPRANWTTAVIAAVVVWLVFVKWLGVPLPIGPFGV